MFNWLQISSVMLKEIEIENFKSIGPKIRIEFKPLTIFVGLCWFLWWFKLVQVPSRRLLLLKQYVYQPHISS